jgi:hypothetical protein
MYDFIKIFEWSKRLFKDYKLKFTYDNQTNFGIMTLKVGTEIIYLYGCDDKISATINSKKLKDIKKELREFYDAKHN